MGMVSHCGEEISGAFFYFEKALDISTSFENALEKQQTLIEIGDGYYRGHSPSLGSGVAYTVSGNVEDIYKALKFYQQALQIAESLGNKEFQKEALIKIDRVYFYLGFRNPYKDEEPIERDGITKSRFNFKKAINLYQKSDDSLGAANTALQISRDIITAIPLDFLWAFSVSGDYESYDGRKLALEFSRYALDIYSARRDRSKVADAIYQIGRIHDPGLFRNGLLESKPKVIQELLSHLYRALEIYREVEDRAGEAKVLNAIGLYEENSESSKQSFQQALLILQELGDKTGEWRTLYNLYNIQVSIFKDNFEDNEKLRQKIFKISGFTDEIDYHRCSAPQGSNGGTNFLDDDLLDDELEDQKTIP